MKFRFIILLGFISAVLTIAQSNNQLNSTFLSADFETLTFPPQGWTLDTTQSNFWSRVAFVSGYGSGTGSVKFAFYKAVAGTKQSLTSPVFPPSGSGDSLKFDYAYATYLVEKIDRLEIDYSKDGGVSFTALVTLNGGDSGELVTAPGTANSFIPTASQWGTRSIALPNGTNKLKFKTISEYGNNLYLDNIKVGPVNLNDAGVFSIDMSAVNVAGSIIPKATIKNYGSEVQSSVPVKMLITPGNYSSSDTITTINPGLTQQATFTNWSAISGVYRISVITQLSGDTNTINDTASMVVTITKAGWISGSNLNVATVLGSGCSAVINDTPFVFSMGGDTKHFNEVNKYNYFLDSWSAVAPIPGQRLSMASAAAMGKIYVFGGTDAAGDYTDTVLSYDMKNNTWSFLTKLPTKLAWSKADTYEDSLIYVAGGYDSLFNHIEVLVYNINNNSFRIASSLPVPAGTWGGAMAISGNTIVYTGGFVYNVGIVASTYVGVINDTDRTQISWSVKTPFPGGSRWTWDAGTWRDGIIVSGGRSTQQGSVGSSDCYSYNIAQDKWTQKPNKLNATFGASVGSFRLSDGSWRYVLAGGVTNNTIYPYTDIFFEDSLITTGVSNIGQPIPTNYSLSQNYPNPFNPDTKIRFSIPLRGFVSLNVYNSIGQKLITLISNQVEAGEHEVTFNGANLSSGIYFYELKTATYISIKKMVLIK